VWAEAGYDPAFEAEDLTDSGEGELFADDSGAADADEDGLLWHGGAEHWHDGPLDV